MRKFLSVFLCLCLIFTTYTVGISAGATVEAENDTVTLVACSDFQHPDGNDAG